MSATISEWPSTVVLGILGVLAQRCWNLSWPMRSMKLKASAESMILLTPTRSVCCSTCWSISSRVASMP